MRIEHVKARVILNSRGEKTIEIEVNKKGIGSAPSGKSKGKYEIPYFPDNDVFLAVERFNSILAPHLIGTDIFGFPDLSYVEDVFFEFGGYDYFGGNTLIALEFAIIDAFSKEEGKEKFEFFKPKELVRNVVTRPLGNVIGGGKHSNQGRSIQEFLIYPKDVKTVKEAVFINANVHKQVGILLSKFDKSFNWGKNDENAWTTSLDTKTTLDILHIIREVIRDETGYEIEIGIDVAASNLYTNGKYVYDKDQKELDREQQIEWIDSLVKDYKLFYVEDPLHEDDFEGFSELVARTPAYIVGDDLIVTNPERLRKAIRLRSVNGVIIKPNQIGSLLKAFEVVKLCKENEILPIISHRSGETTDNTIAHLAVAWEIPIIKTGVIGGERISKLNELIRIEERLFG